MDMKKLWVLTTILVVLFASVWYVTATPTLVSGSSTDPTTSCTTDITNEKTYLATMTDYNLGLVCGDNAKIVLYACKDESCTDKEKIVTAFKVNGAMPLLKGFTIGNKYHYACYECPKAVGKCPITVNEGELVQVKWQGSDPDKDVGPQGKLTYEFDGKIGNDGTWQTKKGDAGVYTITGKVYDGEFWDTTSFCVEVLAVNQPPQLTVAKTVTVYETETVRLNAQCVDPDLDDQSSVTYSGWMESGTKKTDYGDAGTYEVTVKCVDTKKSSVTEKVTVIVLHKNRPPKITWEKA